MDKIILVLKRMFSLLVVFLMLGATTITSGRLFGHEWRTGSSDMPVSSTSVPVGEGVPAEEILPVQAEDSISNGLRVPDALQKRDLGLLGASFKVRDSLSWTVAGKDGEYRGILLGSEKVGTKIEGFAGRIPLFILIDPDGLIEKMAVGQNDETPNFLDRAAEEIFASYYGKTPAEAMETEVDAVSGATYSSNGLIGNIRVALAAYLASIEQAKGAAPAIFPTPGIGWWKTIALFLVLAFGIVASYCLRGKKWARLLVLSLNVLVTGFWCGQFLSMSILTKWMQNGFNVITVLPTLVMLVVAILMPYLGKHNHYCMSICPFGSFQELVWHIPVKKLRLKPAALKWMGRIRTSVFIVLMALLWLGWAGSILDYEPFGAFMVKAAAPAVMILAGVFIVLAVFIPRPWCKTFCPVGELLHLAETPVFKSKVSKVR